MVNTARSLSARRVQANVLLNEGILQSDPMEIEQLVVGTRQDVLTLKTLSEPFRPIAPLLAPVPRYGPLIAAAPRLLDMADAASEAAVFITRGLLPALTLIQQESGAENSQIATILLVIKRAKPDLAQAAGSLERLVELREKINDEEQFPDQVSKLLDEMDGTISVAQDSLAVSQILPSLMGLEGRRTYLILAQNEDELRPTGGFIGGAGVMVVEDGQILSLKFEDTYSIDDWRNKPYGTPPEPFQEIMGMDIFLFRDANFWPDFPTSAEKIMQLYTYGKGVPLDGVIAIDQRLVKLLIEASGPLYVPELDQTVNASNVIEEMRNEWGPDTAALEDGPEWIWERKAFMGPLADAFKERLFVDILSVDLPGFARAVLEGLNQRHIQIFIREPQAATVMEELGWDGGLQIPEAGDFLFVVDTNMGFNKVNAAVDRALTYRVRLDESGVGFSEVQVQYNHTAPATGEPCQHGTRYTADTLYTDLVEDCYWNYLRIYVPDGSQLSAATEHPVSKDQLMSNLSWEGRTREVTGQSVPLTIFDNFLLIAPGERLTYTLSYELPPVVTSQLDGNKLYQLTVGKQAGTRNEPLQIIVELPDDAQLLSSSLVPTQQDEQELVFSTELDSDLMLRIEYRQ
jgi:hypothetical protein